MNRPLLIAALGVVVIVAAVALNFIPRTPEGDGKDAVRVEPAPAPPGETAAVTPPPAAPAGQAAPAPSAPAAPSVPAMPAVPAPEAATPAPSSAVVPAPSAAIVPGASTVTVPSPSTPAFPAPAATVPAPAVPAPAVPAPAVPAPAIPAPAAPPPTAAPVRAPAPAQPAVIARTTPEATPPRVIAPSPVPEPMVETPAPPTFDVVRVSPEGDTVMAGRAEPGSRVVIRDSSGTIGEVDADRRGEWVFVPDAPLPAGSRQLSLEMTAKDHDPVPSESVVVVIVPEKDKDIAGRPAAPAATQQPLVMKVPRKARKIAPTKVLQKPVVAGETFTVTVDAVDYNDAGQLAISGSARPGARVRLYLDNDFIGDAVTGNDGTWTLEPNAIVLPGLYKLRADHVDAAGKVLARVALPFARAAPLTDLPPGGFIVVQPGNSLWRIARHTYGQGIQYTVIFDANRDQIRDEDLIYPGQIFTLPAVN